MAKVKKVASKKSSRIVTAESETSNCVETPLTEQLPATSLPSVCEIQPQLHAKSFYTEPPIELKIGSTIYYIHSHTLPALWKKRGHAFAQKALSFPEVDAGTGHILVNFLYTGRYETLENERCTSPLSRTLSLRQALSIYITATDNGILDLAHLAFCEIESYGAQLAFTDLLGAVNGIFPKLGPAEDMVRGYLCARAKIAFKENCYVFTGKEFAASMDDAALIKFIMSYALDLILHMRTERPLAVGTTNLRPREQSAEEHQDAGKDIEPGIDFIAPTIDDCSVEGLSICEAYGADLGITEDFCAISCPPSICCEEASEVPSDVVVCDEQPPPSVEDEALSPVAVQECPDQVSHVLQGDLWKDCALCTMFVEQLAVQAK